MSRPKVKFTKRLSVRLTAIGAVLALGAIAIASSLPSSGEPTPERGQEGGGDRATSGADSLKPIPIVDDLEQAMASSRAPSQPDTLPAAPRADRYAGPADDRFAVPVFSMPSPDETVMRGNDGGAVIQASTETPVSDSAEPSNRNSGFSAPEPSAPRFTLPDFPPTDDTELRDRPEATAWSEGSPSPLGARPTPLTSPVPGPPATLAVPAAAAAVATDSLRQASQAAIGDMGASSGGERFEQTSEDFPPPDMRAGSSGFEAPSQTSGSEQPQTPSVYGNAQYENRDSDVASPLRPEAATESGQFGGATALAPLSPAAASAGMAAAPQPFEGNGVPGTEAIEGTQSPSLTIEKIAPPEIQVGKETEFEIVVRNTGQVAAADVVVLDDVPRGTRFVNASPEATRTAEGQLMWQVGTLQPGEERVVKIQLLPIAEGEIGSVAQVLFQSQASVRTICTKPELTVKHTGPQKVLIGETVTLDITVENPGTGAATNVVLEEDVPDGLVHAAGRELERDLGTLRPGESQQVRLALTADRPGLIQNVVLVRGDGNLLVQDAINLEVIAPALEVSIDGPRLRYLERPATYEIDVANPGTASAKEVELVTYLPKGMKFVSADHKGDYEPQNHAVYWSLEELPAKQSGTAKLTLLPLETGEWDLRVEGRAGLGLQHADEQTVQVESLAQLQFTIADESDPIEVGADTTYIITLNNSGSSAATDIRLAIGLPPQLKAIGGDGPTRVLVEGGRMTIDPLGRLGAGEQAVYKIRVQGLEDGQQRFQVQLLTAETPVPVTKEEITRVYSDK